MYHLSPQRSDRIGFVDMMLNSQTTWITRCYAYCNRLFRPGSGQRNRSGLLPPGIVNRKEWHPTHRHKKGGLYRFLGRGTLESDRSEVVIYDDEDGTIWVRTAVEFDDGRFSPYSA